jgi:putative phosphoribosyl transferase
MRFRDRQYGGRLLAEKLEAYRTQRPIVLGLTRGGVLVASEVARALGAVLDVMVVRKLGAPECPEYAVGAIAEGGAVYVNPEAVREVGLSDEELAALAEREASVVARRVLLYRGDRGMADVGGRTAIVVDDGVATGATARAAARAARGRGAARVVLAAPVIAAASVPELLSDFDDVVAVEAPEPFLAVGLWYERFGQISDEEVIAALARAGGREEPLAIPFDASARGPGVLEADLVEPPVARGLVLCVHGSGSSRRSPRNRFVARALQREGFATLLLDLLTFVEAAEDELTEQLRFDVGLLAARVVAATRWVSTVPGLRGLPLAYFGSSTGAAAALAAAATLPGQVAAVVSRGGRPDLVSTTALERVRAPVLLLVGSRDEVVLSLTHDVLPHLALAELTIVPGATHLFEEPGALESVARVAVAWLGRRLMPQSSTTPAA